MVHIYQSRNISQKRSSQSQSRFAPPPVIQPKAAKKPKQELPEWKPGGSEISPLLIKLRDAAAVQAKLAIGPNDKYEQEADRVAYDVVRHINSSVANTVSSESSINCSRGAIGEIEKGVLRRSLIKSKIGIVKRSHFFLAI